MNMEREAIEQVAKRADALGEKSHALFTALSSGLCTTDELIREYRHTLIDLALCEAWLKERECKPYTLETKSCSDASTADGRRAVPTT